MTEPSSFIELDRRFRKLDRQAKPEDSALDSYTRTLLGEPGLSWDDLLKSWLVVVLGEPGSGKTWEFRHRAKLLTAEGKYGFFIRLDQLATQPIDEVLSSDDYGRFQSWREGGEEATFLLDSVDEAKFQRLADFYTALERFRDGLGNGGPRRAKILLSSRISEWQPQSDAYELLARFPVAHPLPKRPAGSTGDKGIQSEQLLVVEIEPLDRDRVERFARARGVAAGAFVATLDEHHAWEFSRRPVDVVALANYWGDHGRLGSLKELIEYDISCKLRPSERDRDDPLSEKQAREGTEALGAATVLCRHFNFKVPDQIFVVTEAIDAFSCLPEAWTQELCRVLLTRPIFDSASYGRIRFHHRRVAEYLAAQWLATRMREGCPTTELEKLLFDHFESRRVIRPALAPIAAWLCCGTEPWNEDVRGWVIEAEPVIHLQYGDPEGLPLGYKRDILKALVRRYEGRKHIRLHSSSETLSRLADPGLAENISEIVRDPTVSVDLRAEMLQLIRHGRLQGCLEVALDLIASNNELDELKSYAAAAIRDMDDPPSLRRLADIMARIPQIPNNLCIRVCEALYPRTIDAGVLTDLLRKTDPVPRYSTGLPYYLKSHLESALNPSGSGELLGHFVELCQTPPHLSSGGENIPVSQQFYWIGEVIPTVLNVLLQKLSLTQEESQTAATAFWLLGLLRHDPELNHEKLDDLCATTIRHPSVRQRYLWRLVAEWRNGHKKEPTLGYEIFGYYEVLRLETGDLQWLVGEIAGRSDPKDRELALRLAVQLWDCSGRRWRDRRRIRHAIANVPSLLSLFKQLAAGRSWMWLRRMWYRFVNAKLVDSWWWKRRFREIQHRWLWLRDQWILLRHVNSLASGKRTHWLAGLVDEAEDDRNNQWAPTTWGGLRKRRGRIITWAAKEGCKRAWRLFVPLLPHEKPNPRETDSRVIVGLAGLQAAVRDGDLKFSTISDADAKLAVCYAVNELNGFAPWLTELAAHRPVAVWDVLSECIRGEWQISGPEQVHEVMANLAWHGEKLAPLVQNTVLALLQTSDPPNHSILRSALSMLFKQKQPPVDALAVVAGERVRQLRQDDPGYLLWLAVWLQLDAQQALNMLDGALSGFSNASQIMVRLCALLGERDSDALFVASPSYLNPPHLRRFIPLIYRHVKQGDDIDRTGTGAFSPGERDHAQRFRDSLLPGLARSESFEAVALLRELQDEPVLARSRDWIQHLVEECTARRADLLPWNPTDIRSFEKEYEIDPKTDRDLFNIVCKRLSVIKLDVEKSDNSLRDDLRPEDMERKLRRWLARELTRRACNRYTASQEEEIDRQERPDLRIENPKVVDPVSQVVNPVSIEVKWAYKWSLQELLDALEHQLIGKYLRAHNSRYGVYLLGMIGNKAHWESPNGMLTFQQLLEIIEKRAKELVATRSDVSGLAVVGIDFRALAELKKRRSNLS